MALSLPHIALSLRWIPPGIAIIGYSPLYLTNWTAIRLLTLPLPRRAYTWLEETMYSNYQAMVGFYYETWSGVEFCFYGDKIPDEPENVLYLSNHQCSMDWVISEVLCVKQGGYGGRVRYILKDTIKFVPLYGWYLGHRGGLFVKRKGDEDRKTLVDGLKRYVKNNVPVWLVIFPEGTRYSSKRLEQSRAYARSNGLQELSHVLTPRTKGFEMALEHAGSHFNAVYDVTIYYEGMQKKQTGGRDTLPNLFSFFTGVCRKVHIHIKRTPIEDIPTDEEGRKAWMYETYARKDKLLREVMTLGRFSDDRVSHHLPLFRSLLPTLLFTGTLVGALTTHYGRLWWLTFFSIYTFVTFTSALLSR